MSISFQSPSFRSPNEILAKTTLCKSITLYPNRLTILLICLFLPSLRIIFKMVHLESFFNR